MCDANVQKPLSKKEMLLRAVIFAVAVVLVFLYLNAVFTIPNSDPNRRIFNAFYAEKKDTIDAVYLGTSATNRYFIGPLAYEETGLAEFDLAAMGMPLIFMQNLMKEVEKTQDPALYIIELRGVLKGREDVTDAHIDVYKRQIIILGLLLEPQLKKLVQILHINVQSRGWKVFCVLRTFFLIVVGRMFPKAASFGVAMSMYASIFSFGGSDAGFWTTLMSLGLNWGDLVIIILACAVWFLSLIHI